MAEGAVDRRTRQSINAFHVMVKPTGALCNLTVPTCFYLHKQEPYKQQKRYKRRGSGEVHL